TPDVFQLGKGQTRAVIFGTPVSRRAGGCADLVPWGRVHYMSIPVLISCVALAAWLYLLIGRGMFWRARERDEVREAPQIPAQWPSVTAVIPARNEADAIAASLRSVLAQDYPGPFRVLVVDDDSDDGTAATARGLDRDGRLTVVTGTARPAGWTGKLWAVAQGVTQAAKREAPDYLWL